MNQSIELNELSEPSASRASVSSMAKSMPIWEEGDDDDSCLADADERHNENIFEEVKEPTEHRRQRLQAEAIEFLQSN